MNRCRLVSTPACIVNVLMDTVSASHASQKFKSNIQANGRQTNREGDPEKRAHIPNKNVTEDGGEILVSKSASLLS